MISRRHMLLIGGAAAMPWPGRAQQTPAKKRIALIIGNASYSEGIGTLSNPINDANVVAEGVRNCGFRLVSGDIVQNAGRSAMMSAIRDYVAELKAAGPEAMGFFYYSGHGAARETGGNYLIPVGEADELNEALWDDSVELDWVMERLDALEAPSVVAIDACRNVLKLPEAQRSLGGGEAFRGLRRTAGGAGERNMFLSFATWEGETASDGRADDGNGPYARALGIRLNEPATTVRDMFEQVRLDVLEQTLQRQEPMNLSRLQRRSSDIKIGSWTRDPSESSAETSRYPLRHALIIANSYSDAGDLSLPNVHHDGEIVRSALASAGYETVYLPDGNDRETRDQVDLFVQRLDAAGPASVGLVYFAGYGTALDGENVLLPQGPIPRSKSELRDQGIWISDLVAQMEAASSQAIMMLVDCGRPFSLGGEKGEDRGFSESFGKDRVVVAYADAPGTYHPDGKAPSLFADAFARNVVTPDRISIQSVLRRVNDDVMHASEGQQRPWFQTSLDLPIYFRADLLPEEAGEPSAEDSSPNSPRRYKRR